MSSHEINIGVDGLKLLLFVGEEDKETFLSEIDKLNQKDEYNIILGEEAKLYAQGLHVFDMIWVESWDRKILLHEFQHYLDDLFNELTIVSEVEAKAIFMSNTLEQVLEIRDEAIKEE